MHMQLSKILRLWRYTSLRFIIVGAINTAFGYGVYVLLVLATIPYQLATILSTILGIIFNFFTTGRIVFNNTDLRKVVSFFAAYFVVLIINLVLLTALVEAGFSKFFSPVAVLPVCVLVSFLLNKHFVFRPKP